MDTLHLDGPTSILMIEGLTLPEMTEEFTSLVSDAAPEGSNIRVCTTMKEAVAEAAQAEVIFGIITEQLFAAAPRLRWVHAIASGVDAFMFDAFVQSDVILTGEKGLVGGHLADTGFGLLLALTRQIHTAIKLGPTAWSHRRQMRSIEVELEGLTMGVVGFGGTGRAMARRAQAFGMEVLAVDEYPSNPDHGVEEVWPVERLDDLLAESDVVSICCPLTPSTASLINRETLGKMRQGAYLMNVTRGEVVDNDALVDALSTGHLAGAALDVVAGEPLDASHPLFALDNVAMTPHTAGASQLRAPRNVARFAENLRRAQRGESLVGVVDKTVGY